MHKCGSEEIHADLKKTFYRWHLGFVDHEEDHVVVGSNKNVIVSNKNFLAAHDRANRDPTGKL